MFFQIETNLWWFPSDFQILPPSANVAHGRQLSNAVRAWAHFRNGGVSVKFFSRAWKKAKIQIIQAQSWLKLINKFCETNFSVDHFFSFGSRIYQIDVRKHFDEIKTHWIPFFFSNFPTHSSVLFGKYLFFFRFRLMIIRSCVECSYKWNSKFFVTSKSKIGAGKRGKEGI